MSKIKLRVKIAVPTVLNLATRCRTSLRNLGAGYVQIQHSIICYSRLT